jgi:predicted RND superfamily exporter protein
MAGAPPRPLAGANLPAYDGQRRIGSRGGGRRVRRAARGRALDVVTSAASPALLGRIHQWSVLGPGRPFFLAAVAALTVIAAYHSLGVRQDESNAAMNSTRDDQRRAEEVFRRDFGDDEIVVLGLTHPDLLGDAGIAALQELTARIAALDSVHRVTSLVTVRQIVSGPGGAEPVPLVPGPEAASSLPGRSDAGPVPAHPVGEDPGTRRAAIERAIDDNPHLTGLLISRDRRTAALVIEIEDRPGDEAYRARLVETLRAVQAEPRPAGEAIHLTGITVQKYDTTRLVRRDQAIVLPLSVLILAIALGVVTRSVAGVVLPLLVTGVTTVWTIGLYAAVGLRVNVITSLLPPLLLVLSVTTAIHLFQEWVAQGPAIHDRASRMPPILGDFVAPCFMTALTTAIGLGSLAVGDIPAVRLFGVFGAFGIMLSFALNFTLLPAVLSYLDPPPPRPRRAGALLERGLDGIARLAVRRPLLVFLAAAVPTVAALVVVPAIRNNTDLIRFLRPSEPLARDTRFIDRTIGGANAIDLMIERRDGKPLTGLDDVRRIDAFVQRVRALPAVTGAFALTDLLKQLQRAERRLAAPALPDDPDDLLLLFDLLDAAEDQDDIRRVMTPDAGRARITLRLRAIGTEEAEELIETVARTAREVLGPDRVMTPTGGFYKITVDSNRLVAGQVRSFGLALALVLLVIGLTLKSAKLLVAAILPNVVPILWTAGIMGWAGIDLSTATTMVASVVLGIAVDDAIHYLARFRREYRGDLEDAVRRTTRTTGRVLVMTSAVLTLGFWVGGLSSFRPTVYFSLLSGVTMLTALVCTIALLPAILRVLHAEREVSR